MHLQNRANCGASWLSLAVLHLIFFTASSQAVMWHNGRRAVWSLQTVMPVIVGPRPGGLGQIVCMVAMVADQHDVCGPKLYKLHAKKYVVMHAKTTPAVGLGQVFSHSQASVCIPLATG